MNVPRLLPVPPVRSRPSIVVLAVMTVAALGVAVLGAGSPAWADVVAPEATGSTVSDVAAQAANTVQLQERAAAQTTAVARAQAGLLAASASAGAALETYTTALRTLDAAQLAETARHDALAAATSDLAQNRQKLGRWARSAYTGRDALDGHGLVETVLSARTTDVIGSNLVILRRLGDERAHDIDAARGTQEQQDAARVAAEQAAVRAENAAVAAAAAKESADTAVQAQKDLLAQAQGTLVSTREALDESARKDRAAALVALAGSAAGTTAQTNTATGAVGDCTGGATESYANGAIPLSALCPLWGAPQHHLRADAAHAFDQLSQAYSGAFGTPICITDSYRTFAQQVDLRARKPTLAAVPGTSNHGWGTATDLCGGIQDFSSAQHRWMSANAPLYGWFHPAWAAAGGSKPEPWHWEFGG